MATRTKKVFDLRLEDHRPYELALLRRSTLIDDLAKAERELKAAKEAASGSGLKEAGKEFLASGALPKGDTSEVVSAAELKVKVIKRALLEHERVVEEARSEAEGIVAPKLRASHEKAVADVLTAIKPFLAALNTERAIRIAAPKIMAGPTSVISAALKPIDIEAGPPHYSPLEQALQGLKMTDYKVKEL